MDAIVVLRLTLRNVVDAEELLEEELTFEDCVKGLLPSYTLGDLGDGSYTVVSVEVGS